ncbi:DUF3256 family protein [uncultured Bacteroides sp.]|uniref:DUF3256 family protein n=1 Tax=uncultured Bacteroides sp. TaxID=162156 RepID=UPI002629AA0D|nr:DUF3256 family protein [uncultured Bacteroides sp.]
MRFILLLSILLGLSANAQNINSVFVSMPDSLSPLLTKVNRQDFADFLSSGMKAVVKNRFGGKSEMLKLTDDYLKIKTTESSSEEMKLLPLNDSVNVVCVIKTYSGPAEDSRVYFYSTDWKELPLSEFISLPQHADFYKAANDSINTVSKEEFTDEMFVMKAELSDKDNNIVFKYKTLETMGKENAELMKPYAVDSLKFKWNNGVYVKE